MSQSQDQDEPNKSSRKLHIVMFPWFAMGHITPFLHLSNNLAQRGHKVSFLLSKKPLLQLQPLNLHPNLITFHQITIPYVDGLPPGAETTADITLAENHFLATAMDLTRHQVESIISTLNPNLIFYDLAHWVPDVAKKIGAHIKTVSYTVVSAVSIAIALVPARNVHSDKPLTEEELRLPPAGYPSTSVVLRGREVRSLMFIAFPFGEGLTFYERVTEAMKKCDILAMRTCQELEGKICDYIGTQYKKSVLLTGPVLDKPEKTGLEDRWAKWLDRFEPNSVVFAAFGSQLTLEKAQFQELLLGLEATGHPFLAAVKPPLGCKSVEDAYPDGFQNRVGDRGKVHEGWVQQTLILGHKSIGCFVTHCGFGSMWEGLMSDSQMVMVPFLGDQRLNTRLMSEELKVGVEVERHIGDDREDKGDNWFSKEGLRKAVKNVMDKESEVGIMARKNHAKWKETLSNPGFMSGYLDRFVQYFQQLV